MAAKLLVRGGGEERGSYLIYFRRAGFSKEYRCLFAKHMSRHDHYVRNLVAHMRYKIMGSK